MRTWLSSVSSLDHGSMPWVWKPSISPPGATAFASISGPPPIDCEGGGGRGREILEVLQLRAAGERAQGRLPGGDDDLGSPAEEELEQRLAQAAGQAGGGANSGGR